MQLWKNEIYSYMYLMVVSAGGILGHKDVVSVSGTLGPEDPVSAGGILVREDHVDVPLE